MKYVAFFRNVNLGRAPSPTKAQLLQAFSAAGAEAESFQSNGTVIFDAASSAQAKRVVVDVRASLRESTHLREPAFVRSIRQLAKLVRDEPFAAISDSPHAGFYVTFFDGPWPAKASEVLAAEKATLEILKRVPGMVLSVARHHGARVGKPNAAVENSTGGPASTRSWTTIVRIGRRYT